MTFRELCSKEVVQLKDGACLGRVDDAELDADTARIGSLLLLGRPRLFGLLGRDETLTIPCFRASACRWGIIRSGGELSSSGQGRWSQPSPCSSCPRTWCGSGC